MTFIGYVQRFNQPIAQISVLWTNIQSAIAGAERIFDLLDEAPAFAAKPDAAPMPAIRGASSSTGWAPSTRPASRCCAR